MTVKDKSANQVDINVKKDIASSLLVCVGDIFEKKLSLAFKEFPEIKSITFVGGVACNKYLKERLRVWSEKRNLKYFTPSAQYCTDNAAMIAFVGHYKAQQDKFDSFDLDIF
jgi:N6-L-threonylcarbamoyladenine synthase